MLIIPPNPNAANLENTKDILYSFTGDFSHVDTTEAIVIDFIGEEDTIVLECNSRLDVYGVIYNNGQRGKEIKKELLPEPLCFFAEYMQDYLEDQCF